MCEDFGVPLVIVSDDFYLQAQQQINFALLYLTALFTITVGI